MHDFGATLFMPALMRSLGGKKRFSASSVDQLPKMLSGAAMFGGSLTIPIPDVDRCDHLLVLGANPLAAIAKTNHCPANPVAINLRRFNNANLILAIVIS